MAEKRTEHCPFCDDEDFRHRWIGQAVTEEKSKERFCNECGKDFTVDNIVVKIWKLVEKGTRKDL